MILSISYEGIDSCKFTGFVEKKLSRIKVNRGPKAPPSAWYRVKYVPKNLLKVLDHV